MTDARRSYNMSCIKGKDTKPEMIVRKYLWSRGFRYRLNHPRLPGHPDIVLHQYRTCIFVNGCFWHGHEGCKYYSTPKSNIEFWTSKISRNRERDARVNRQLTQMGWYSITIWECDLKPHNRARTLSALVFNLSEIYLKIHENKGCEGKDNSLY